VRVLEVDPAGIAERGGVAPLATWIRSHVPAPDSVASAVAEIIERVRTGGDEALAALVREHDAGGADPLALLVADHELDAAREALDPAIHDGLQNTIANVMFVAQTGVGEDAEVTLPQGHLVRTREIPVERAAVYVPGGQAAYPSTVVMGVVTARAAGVSDVVVCAPPSTGGDIHPLVLGAARLCGATAVYRMGGAQAIAALAHGTETVPAVDVIVGPGNLYVQEAKRQLSGVVGIDGFAGPSDLVVLASPDAPAHLVAYDLLAQGEHGPDSLVVAVSPSADWLVTLAGYLERLDVARPDTSRPGAIVLVNTADLDQALDVSEALAPEHLQLMGGEAEALAFRVRRAGCVLVGWPSGTAFGDYVAGSNHILPTQGSARFASALGPRHFRRRMAEVHIGGAARVLATAAGPVARAEGFVLHAESMEARAPDAFPPPPPPAATVVEEEAEVPEPGAVSGSQGGV
jgi:histidinol dehydrogenase